MRTVQDLLAERRLNVQELRHERDPMARAMLQWHVDQLDREIAIQAPRTKETR